MVELSNERIEQILHNETVKAEDKTTILRGIYIRYMNLYEHYFADFEALNDDKIAEFRKQHEETKSLFKYYYMDIPQDICAGIREIEENSSSKMLGNDWKKTLYDAYDKFKEESNDWEDKGEDYYKAEFAKKMLKDFYAAMDYVFRDGFGTVSQNEKGVLDGLSGLLFGSKKEEK